MALRLRAPFLLPLLAACHAPPAPVRASVVDARPPAMHLRCEGAGSPVIVLEAGMGDDSSTWTPVFPALARASRTCAYDRLGTGASGPAPRPHGGRQMADELHALLLREGVAPPYVLVGHSFGGLVVRLFAAAHDAEVAGMVLVDASSDEQDQRYWSLFPTETLEAFRARLAGSPEGLDLDAFRGTMVDLRRLRRSLGDRPLLVLSRGQDDPPPPGVSPALAGELSRTWRGMQVDLARQSANAAHVVAENSHHYLQWEAPRLVIASVGEVVRAARAHDRVDPRPLAPLAKLPAEGGR